VARLKPRFNAAVNRWWICDEGRYGFGFVDDASRLRGPLRREDGEQRPATWDDAVTAVAALVGQPPPDAIGIIASPKMSNEDLFALTRLCARLGVGHVGVAVPPGVPGDEDALLIKADKNPNTRGAELIGLDGDVAATLAAARAHRLRCLWIFDHDLFTSAWPEPDVRAALEAVDTLIWSGTNANRTSALAHWVLPVSAWVERDGTYTNFEGRVQRFRAAVEPLGEARPTWEVLGRLLTALGEPPGPTRAEQWFRALAEAVPAFAGLSYGQLGETGQLAPGAA
jgi:NADH-quinone oxidoreductase subunit G